MVTGAVPELNPPLSTVPERRLEAKSSGEFERESKRVQNILCILYLSKLNSTKVVPTGYMYILKCSNDQYYTGSTKNLKERIKLHQNGRGVNITKKLLPVELKYYEEYDRIEQALRREKQIQGWSRAKKEALMNGDLELLNNLASCRNKTHFKFNEEE